MEGFDKDFGGRHAAAFAALHQRLGLDYFAIDCAETPDGGLLIFEADVAMIVHDLDPAGLYPYKKTQMRAVFDAFEVLLRELAAGSRATRSFSGSCSTPMVCCSRWGGRRGRSRRISTGRSWSVMAAAGSPSVMRARKTAKRITR